MISITEILKKYTKLVSVFLPGQKIDLWILENFLFDYKPRKNTYVMCVGGMYGEKDVIKKFHHKNHKINNITVAACNILPIYFMHSANYDYRLSGKKGDASNSLMWDTAKNKLNITKFDLVYIRYPDLFETSNWEQVLELSLKNITKQGAVFMLIREVDLEKLNRFLKNIKHKPVIKKKTNISFFGKQSSIYHTVLVFKT